MKRLFLLWVKIEIFQHSNFFLTIARPLIEMKKGKKNFWNFNITFSVEIYAFFPLQKKKKRKHSFLMTCKHKNDTFIRAENGHKLFEVEKFSGFFNIRSGSNCRLLHFFFGLTDENNVILNLSKQNFWSLILVFDTVYF